MSTAVEWEREHAEILKEMADALAENDPYLAAEILNRIAPLPEGENVRSKERGGYGLDVDHTLEVIDPATGKLHNPDGPAVIKRDGTRKWYKSGLQHNSSAPAVIKPNGELRYYYLGTKCKTAAELDDTVKRAREWAQKSHNARNPQGTTKPAA